MARFFRLPASSISVRKPIHRHSSLLCSPLVPGQGLISAPIGTRSQHAGRRQLQRRKGAKEEDAAFADGGSLEFQEASDEGTSTSSSNAAPRTDQDNAAAMASNVSHRDSEEAGAASPSAATSGAAAEGEGPTDRDAEPSASDGTPDAEFLKAVAQDQMRVFMAALRLLRVTAVLVILQPLNFLLLKPLVALFRWEELQSGG